MRPRSSDRRPLGSNLENDVMGIFGALTTAVGGLRAQSYALENVSGNIANSQTTAFKRIDTSFLDLIPQTALTTQLAGGVTTQSRSTNSVQGDVQTGVGRDLHGDQRRRLLRGAEARQPSPTARRYSTASTATPAAATSSSTRAAISSTAPAIISRACRSIRPPATRPAVRRRCCNSRTISCRRRRPPRSTTAPTSRAIR